MKSLIVTENCLYDVNEKFLEAGKYYFLIKRFTDDKSVIGDIIEENKPNSQYEFRFFTLMTMIVKGQSYLARRLDNNLSSPTLQLREKYMPNFPSPKKTSQKKLNLIKKMNTPLQCMICLSESNKYDFSLKKLSCGHYFHNECIDEWFQKSLSCPVCREEVTISL